MKKLKLAVMLLILTATSNVFADHHIKIEPEDKILLSSNTIYILNNSKQYALYHSCDLNVNINSEVIVKNKGRKISKRSTLNILVDGRNSKCRVKSIEHA